MAARSPEPAKRWLSPQSLSASPAGRGRASTAPRISIGAATRAEGVIGSRKEQDAHREDDPHQAKGSRTDGVGEKASRHPVAGGEDVGGHQARKRETPGQHQEQQIHFVRDHREPNDGVEHHRDFELIADIIAELGGVLWPVRLAKRNITDPHFTPLRVPDTHDAGPIKNKKGERDLNKHGRKHGGVRHGVFPYKPDTRPMTNSTHLAASTTAPTMKA